MLYKIIGKVLANRLKIILINIIGPNQSAYVPRIITTNIFLAHVFFHSIKRRNRGKCGVMSIKFKISKAYDRIE